MFGLGKKKPICDCTTPCESCKCEPTISILNTKKGQVFTKAFMFSTTLRYKSNVPGNPIGQWIWTSEIYYDYRKALQASYDIVKNINEKLNEEQFNNSFVYFLDSCVRKEDVLTVTSSNIKEVTFSEGIAISEKEILVNEGKI